jgi:hypothetical protein
MTPAARIGAALAVFVLVSLGYFVQPFTGSFALVAAVALVAAAVTYAALPRTVA